MIVDVDFDRSPRLDGAAGNDADAGRADIADGGGHLGDPREKEDGLALRADGHVGQLMVRGHEEKIGAWTGKL